MNTDPATTQQQSPERWTAAQERPDMWVDAGEDARQTGAELTDERSTLLDYLRAYRLTIEMKCAGLDADQLARRSVPPSTMSLLGLIRHLADVERYWFRQVVAGQPAEKRFSSEDDQQGAWANVTASAEQVDEAWAAWREEIAFADEVTAQSEDLSRLGRMRDGGTLQLREVLVHMIEEYARHAGHADLLRECIDGRVGQ